MTLSHVALVNFGADGHHVPYVRDLSAGLANVGVKVIVLGPPALKDMVDVDHFVALRGCENLRELRGWRRQCATVQVCRDAIMQAKLYGATIIHFLYADFRTSAIAAAWWISRPHLKLVVTIHWSTSVGVGDLPLKDRVRRYPHRATLRWLAKIPRARVIVHHEAVASALSFIVWPDRIGIVPYPSEPLPQVSMAGQVKFRRALGLGVGDKLILCYGGTRLDKGVDLAVCALVQLPEEFHLLIAGEAQYFQPSDIQQQAIVLNVYHRVHLMSKILSDAESAIAFRACDVVLLPYRRSFSGQSGPLTLAASLGKAIVVPDLPVLAETVQAFHLGYIYPVEEVGAMAKAIEVAIRYCPDSQNTAAFVAYHSPQAFARSVYENYLKVED